MQPPPPTVSTGLKPSTEDPTALQTGSPPLVTPTAAGAEAVIGPTALSDVRCQVPSGDTPRPATPPASTPLLDADIRRVEDVIRQHSESLRLGDRPTAPWGIHGLADPFDPRLGGIEAFGRP